MKKTPPPRQAIYDDIDDERERQDAKWGGKEHDRKHTVSDWARLIREHTEKARDAASSGDIRHARRRLLEVAALSVAGLEVLDRIDAYNEDMKA